jgi:hypothetical protein
MKKAVFVVMVALLGLYSCSDDPAEPEETVSKPATPVGKDDPELNETNTYKTSAAVSSEGHAVQYRFDLDAGGVHDFTDWSAVDSIAASWPDSGLYVVKAQARCAEHTGTVSVWSDGLMVGAATEFVTAPLEPDGTIYPWPGAPDNFCVAGAAPVRFRRRRRGGYNCVGHHFLCRARVAGRGSVRRQSAGPMRRTYDRGLGLVGG